MAVPEEFWHEVRALRDSQVQHYPELQETVTRASREEEAVWQSQAAEQLEELMLGVVKSLARGESPILRVPRRGNGGGGGRAESLVSLGARSSCRRFVHLLYTAGRAYSLMKRGEYATRRDIFYEGTWLYETQSAVNRCADDLTRVLGVPRRVLHLTNTAKGLVAGQLQYTTRDGTEMDVAAAVNGVLIPDCVAAVSGLRSVSRFVLVVEKDATFQRLIDAHFLRAYGPCILITGKGYPDLCTRELTARLWRELRLPVLALTDADPYGIHIAAVYKFGSLTHSEPELSIPGLVWLGVLPTDLAGLQLPQRHLLPLEPADHGKLATLAAHPRLKGEQAWQQQISAMQQLGYKAEIQNLTHISPDFLTAVYLPTKLRHAGWVN